MHEDQPYGRHLYMPSEVRCLKWVQGRHPNKPGKWLSTSHIVEVDGNLIRTRSGSVYRLGTPHEDYVRWCEANGMPFDAAEPFAHLRAEGEE